MKSFALVLVVLQVVLIQNVFSQVIAAPYTYTSAPIVAQQSVASSLADTLSLLTVSSLLADTLPLSPDVYALSYAPTTSCGCGCGYNNYNGCYGGLAGNRYYYY